MQRTLNAHESQSTNMNLYSILSTLGAWRDGSAVKALTALPPAGVAEVNASISASVASLGVWGPPVLPQLRQQLSPLTAVLLCAKGLQLQEDRGVASESPSHTFPVLEKDPPNEPSQG